MTLDQWIERYNKKSGEIFEIKPSAFFMFDEQRGFLQYSFVDVNSKKTLIIYEVCGSGKHWQSEAVKIAKENNCKQLLTTTTTKPEVYMRRFPETYVHSWVMAQNID